MAVEALLLNEKGSVGRQIFLFLCFLVIENPKGFLVLNWCL